MAKVTQSRPYNSPAVLLGSMCVRQREKHLMDFNECLMTNRQYNALPSALVWQRNTKVLHGDMQNCARGVQAGSTYV